MAESTARVAALSPAKLKILARRLAKTRQRATLPQIVPDPSSRFEPFPLTEVQEAYWLGRTRLFDLGGVSAHGYNEIEIERLDLDRFERALVRVITRHDMLRMVVRPSGLQQVLPEVEDYTLRRYDLSAGDGAAAEEQRLALRQEMSHQVLDASTWPLFDIRACQLPDGRVRLHISFDILVADLTGYQILMRDLARFYADPTWSPPPLELAFRDYVLAHERLAESDHFRRSMEYWSGRLDELQSPPELPLASDPSQLESPRFSRRFATLSVEDWGRLKTRAAQARLSSSGLLIAAFGEVLARWSKEPRFTLTLTLFNPLPLHPQVHDIVGDFTSLALLAIDGGRSGSLEARARAIQEQLGRDLEHSQVGGVRVLRELARQRGMATAAMPVVFTSSLVDGGADGDAPPVDEGLLGESVYSISQTPQVWLDHQVYEQGGALHYNWDSVSGLFPKGMLDAMFATYRELLARLVEDESAWVEPLELALPERQRERRRWVNATDAPIPEGLLHGPFDRQHAASGSRPAVLTQDLSLDYATLDRRVQSLAQALAQRGVGRDRRVAVVMEKGWEQVAAVLAILRAGGTYLPIAADLPEDRIRQLLERGEVTVAVVQERHRSRLEAAVDDLLPAGVVTLDSTVAPADGPAPQPGMPEDLAYVIFTSGSTGQPKGVMTDHRGALNTVVDINQRFEVGPDDRVLALSSLSFDLSVYDIFGLLAVGGAVVLPEPGTERDPAHWADLLERHQVTLWNTVPALMEMLVEDLESRGVSGPGKLRLVMMSGDWIPTTLPDRIRALWPGVQVVSLGGATEASIWSILFPIEEVPEAWSSIPYGRPMLNQTFEVLGPRLQPRPEWVPGDLYIGGIGLAQGYWRDEVQTDASFILHPRTGERLYRTGDLGRWLPEGHIEFLGREDFQVKIQGHRIELGEIEVSLEQHPEVRAAVVDAVGEARGPRSLVAWVVPTRRDEEGHGANGSEAAAILETSATLEPATSTTQGPNGVASRTTIPSLDRLGTWLDALSALDLGDSLCKRRYASAGNLYPVQVYLEVGQEGTPDTLGLASGLYYLDPHTHRLVRLPDTGSASQTGCWLHLVGDRAAITPVYPEWADDFLTLEAGYLLELLAQDAPDLGLGWELRAPAADLATRLGGSTLRPLCSLEVWGLSTEDQAVDLDHGVVAPGDLGATPAQPAGPITDPVELTVWKLAEPGRRRDLEGQPWWALPTSQETPEDREAVFRRRASHRTFTDSALDGDLLTRCLQATWDADKTTLGGSEGLRWIVVPRPGRVAGLEGAYTLGAGGLQPLAEALDDLPASFHGEVNRGIFDSGAVSLFALTDVPAKGSQPASERDAQLLAAGRWGQRLMETAGVLGGLGFCPIGQLDDEQALHRLLDLDPGTQLIHSFIGGGVETAAGETAGGPSADDALIRRLERHLEARLPGYMVPGVFLLLDTLPLSSNGKVDRRALPHPGSLSAAPSEPVAPSRPWEIHLATLWCELLGVESVSVDDNFFALGGDSVRAIRILGQLRQLGVELSARQLFDATSLRRLADLLEDAVGPEVPTAPVATPEESPGQAAAGELDAGFDDDELDDLADEFGDLEGGDFDDDF